MTETERNFIEAVKRKAEKARIEAKLSELESSKSSLQDKILLLKDEFEKEMYDVELLEKVTLSSIFYGIIGKKVEKLDKERNEAYAARLKYEEALRELELVKADIDKCKTAHSSLKGVENEYKRAYNDRLEELKASNSADGNDILTIEQEIAMLEHNTRESAEALSIANRALCIAEEIVDLLKKAKGWSNYDLWLGGGLLADMNKHDYLDRAQNLLESLQDQLLSLKAELCDIKIGADFCIKIEGFTRFSDYFFDGFFSALEVNESIANSLSNAQSVSSELSRLVQNLEEIQNDANHKKDLKEKRIQYIVNKSCE